MKKWILKAIIQKTISYLPFSRNINYFFQKHVTKGVFLTDEYFYDRLGHAEAHLAAYAQFGNLKGALPRTCLELGTGWYPIVPIAFFLSGVEKTYSVDIKFLTNKERILTTIEKFLMAIRGGGGVNKSFKFDKNKIILLSNIAQNPNNYTLAQLLKAIQLEYLIEDARNLSLPDDSIELLNSNNTFEHIYPEILAPILKDFVRVVKKNGGVMSHFVDMSDHFAHFDKSINIYNFLRFSKTEWRWIDNSIQPQSRLRLSDYKKMYEELGIGICAETNRPGRVEELSKINLHADYRDHSVADLAVSHVQLVSKH